MGLLWLGLAAFTVALVVLIWTRWGQYRPLRKCLVLSILAHLLLAGYATTVRIVAMAAGQRPIVRHRLHRGASGAPGPTAMILRAVCGTPRPAAKASPPLLEIPNRPSSRAPSPPSPSPPPPGRRRPCSTSRSCRPRAAPAASRSTGRSARGTARRRPSAAGNRAAPWRRRRHRRRRGRPGLIARGGAAAGRHRPTPVPEVYRLRMAPNHARLAQGHGGSPETEAAVQAALQWLAENQSGDGHWSARQHEAGRETRVDGRDRQHAGAARPTPA